MSCTPKFRDGVACVYQNLADSLAAVDWIELAQLLAFSTAIGSLLLVSREPSHWTCMGSWSNTFLSYHFQRTIERKQHEMQRRVVRVLRDEGIRFFERYIVSLFSKLQYVPPAPHPEPIRIRGRCGARQPYRVHSTVRTAFYDKSATIKAWPSRGGVIILTDIDSVDIKFLGLNPLNPPLDRLENQDDEDAFCQRMLLLGAKWWDSMLRWDYKTHFEDDMPRFGSYEYTEPVVEKEYPLTEREKLFVKVGWPSTGGLWVAEWDEDADGEKYVLMDEVARLRMASTMDERCSILKDQFKATFYATLKEYDGLAFVNSWATKDMGEVGPLLTPEETLQRWWQHVKDS